MSTFEVIKNLAKKKDKTLQDVATDLGFGVNYFYGLNAGKKPTAEKLEAIANYFNVSVDYLLGRTDNPNPISNNSPKEIGINNEYEQELLMMFRKGEKEVAPEKRDLYRKQTKDLMSFISKTMKELDEENDK